MHSPLPTDQADGLRRMFAAVEGVIVPIVANPHVEHHGAILARLAGVFAEQGLNTLVVDAADTAPEPGELAFIDLGACVEPLSPRMAYLAARGLPMQHVDTHGSCASFLPHVMNAVRGVDVVVLHAEARVLARMLAARDLRPVLLSCAAGESLTHAYAALKLLTQRIGLSSFDLVMPTPRTRLPSAQQIADRLADCADRFLDVALHDWAAIDPNLALLEPARPELLRLAAGQLGLAPTAPPLAPPTRRATVGAPSGRPTATAATRAAARGRQGADVFA
ncbi:MAG TPA: flagellar biosynthesis protein [Burkholderiaceae bacterium]|nr:flagellar biosynthesis protein [Burkholderiaceae bacterium]